MEWELPEELTRSILDEFCWLEGLLEGYEICEVGLVRRPKMMRSNGVPPGYLYSPNINVRKEPCYRLNIYGSKSVLYIKPVEILTKLFGEFTNSGLLSNEYARQMKSLVVEYNERNFRSQNRKEYSDREEDGMLKMRVCHDCGKKTRNFRCDSCWAIVKARSTSCDEPISEYGFGRK